MVKENLLTVKEVASRRGVTIWRIHQLIQAGTLAAEKYGNQYLIKESDADALTIHGKAGRPLKIKHGSPYYQSIIKDMMRDGYSFTGEVKTKDGQKISDEEYELEYNRRLEIYEEKSK